MGDGRTFDQAVRALDKLVSEQTAADGEPHSTRVPDSEPLVHPAFGSAASDDPEPGPAAA